MEGSGETDQTTSKSKNDSKHSELVKQLLDEAEQISDERKDLKKIRG